MDGAIGVHGAYAAQLALEERKNEPEPATIQNLQTVENIVRGTLPSLKHVIRKLPVQVKLL